MSPVLAKDLDSPSTESETEEKASEETESIEPKKTNRQKKNSTKRELTPEEYQKKREILGKTIRFGTSQERKMAIAEIIRFPKDISSELRVLIKETLEKDPDPTIRIHCLRAIGEMEYLEGKEPVLSAIRDKNEDVARTAVTTAKQLKLTESVAVLFELLKEKDFTQNQNMTSLLISTLGDLEGGKVASEFLEAKFKDKFNNPDIRSQIALYFGSIKEGRILSSLEEIAMDNSQPTVLRTYCISSVGKIGNPSSIEKLRKLLDDLRAQSGKLEGKKIQSLKIYTISALVLLGDKGILPELIEFTKDDDALVRLRAIEHLGRLKDPQALEVLEYKSVRDISPKVQKAAKKAIEDITGKKSEDPSENTNPTPKE